MPVAVTATSEAARIKCESGESLLLTPTPYLRCARRLRTPLTPQYSTQLCLSPTHYLNNPFVEPTRLRKLKIAQQNDPTDSPPSARFCIMSLRRACTTIVSTTVNMLDILAAPTFQTLLADAALSVFALVICRLHQLQLLALQISRDEVAFLCGQTPTPAAHLSALPSLVEICRAAAKRLALLSAGSEAGGMNDTTVGTMLSVERFGGVMVALVVIKAAVAYWLVLCPARRRAADHDDIFYYDSKDFCDSEPEPTPAYDYLFTSVVLNITLCSLLLLPATDGQKRWLAWAMTLGFNTLGWYLGGAALAYLLVQWYGLAGSESRAGHVAI